MANFRLARPATDGARPGAASVRRQPPPAKPTTAAAGTAKAAAIRAANRTRYDQKARDLGHPDITAFLEVTVTWTRTRLAQYLGLSAAGVATQLTQRYTPHLLQRERRTPIHRKR
ncbi:hypothetical protein [Longispora albida]|uniref:hypothetical protein n=1 Tax=Longispora albida TaxID=203523 RepID=UPI0003A7617C|nr:hypothetical protein [Longispora albida]